MTFPESITLAAVILAGVLGVFLLIMLGVALSRRVFVKIAVRNALRRPLQSSLIIFGLMISTSIIAVTLNFGDTTYFSARLATAFNMYGNVDIIVDPGGAESINPNQVAAVQSYADESSSVDGFLPVAQVTLPTLLEDTGRAEANSDIVAYDPTRLDGFGEVLDLDSDPIDLASLTLGEVVLNANLATTLNAEVGDVILIVPEPGERRTVTVVGIAQVGGLASNTQRLLTTLDTLYSWETVERGTINSLFISVEGELEPEPEVAQMVSDNITSALDDPALLERIAAALSTPEAFRWFSDVGVGILLENTLDNIDGDFFGTTLTQLNPDEIAQTLAGGEVTEDFQMLLRDETFQELIREYLAFIGMHELFADLSIPTVQDVKIEALRLAEVAGSLSTTLFSFFGSFSILAGVFLIILIFVLLASSRQQEMGIARAIGMKRRDLITTYIFEGIVYSVPAAAIGVAFGWLIGYLIITGVVGTLPDVDAIIYTSTIQGSLLAFGAGTILTLITIIISSFWVSRLNIVTAIRGLPPEIAGKSTLGTELLNLIGGPIVRLARLRRARPSKTSSVVGAALWLTFASIALLFMIVSLVTSESMLSFFIGLGAVIGIWIVPSFRSLLKLLAPIVLSGLPALVPSLVILLINRFSGSPDYVTIILTTSFTIVGLGLFLGWITQLFLGRRGIRPRNIIYAWTGVLLVTLFSLQDSSLNWLLNDAAGLDGPNVTFFILGTLLMLGGGVAAVVFMSDTIVVLLNNTVGGIRGMRNVFRLAMSYIFSAKTRVTLIMMSFSLVIFSMVVIAVFTNIGGPTADIDTLTGGFDIRADVREPLDGDLRELITATGVLAPSELSVVGTERTYPLQASELDDDGQAGEAGSILIEGRNSEWLNHVNYELTAFDTSYGSTPREIWSAVAADPSLAIVNAFTLASVDTPSGPPGTEGSVQRGSEGQFRIGTDGSYWPHVLIEDPGFETSEVVQVIGILGIGATFAFDAAIYVNDELLDGLVRVDQKFYSYSIVVADEERLEPISALLEALFIDNSLTTTELAASIQESLDAQDAFTLLFQSFMGIGLVVGTVALGLVAARSVVERRRIIGVTRALGFKPYMVTIQFLLESVIVAVISIGLGIGLGTLLTQRIFNSAINTSDVAGFEYSVPWDTLSIISAVVVGFSILVTLGVAISASRVKPAESLRFE